jgi:hypothetical protein
MGQVSSSAGRNWTVYKKAHFPTLKTFPSPSSLTAYSVHSNLASVLETVSYVHSLRMCSVNIIIWLEGLRKTTIYLMQGNLSASEFRNGHISNAYLECQCYNNLLSLLSWSLNDHKIAHMYTNRR